MRPARRFSAGAPSRVEPLGYRTSGVRLSALTAQVLVLIAFASALGIAIAVSAAESPLGVWKTVDDKTGKVRSDVEVYEEDGKVFGRIRSLADPLGPDGRPKICVKCSGVDKDKPIVGLIIIRGLAPSGDRYGGGTILDPEEGKVYRAEIWVEDGKLKVRGYLGPFYRTQTWLRAS